MISNSLFFDLAGKTILFGTDFSPAANRALPNVTALARRFHCHLLVVHALSKSLAVEAEPEIPQRNDNQPGPEELQNKMRVLLASDALVGLSYEVIVRPGEVWSVVSEIVGEKGVVLVTLGTRGLGGWQKLLSGSVAEDLLRVVAGSTGDSAKPAGVCSGPAPGLDRAGFDLLIGMPRSNRHIIPA